MKLWKFSSTIYTFYVFGPFETAKQARELLNTQYEGVLDMCQLDAEEITAPLAIMEEM